MECKYFNCILIKFSIGSTWNKNSIFFLDNLTHKYTLLTVLLIAFNSCPIASTQLSRVKCFKIFVFPERNLSAPTQYTNASADVRWSVVREASINNSVNSIIPTKLVHIALTFYWNGAMSEMILNQAESYSE